MKVLVKSPFSILSGYGNDGWGLARALVKWGCDVYLQPQWVDCPVPADLLPLLGRTITPPFDLTINHWEPAALGITREAREMTRVAVAWTMWEFAPHPETGKSGLIPHCKRRSTLTRRLKWFDLLLGYDNVSLASLEPYIPRHVARGVLQGGYEAAEWHPVSRDWHGERFMFISHGSQNTRKQPWLTIQAFNELKHEKPAEFAGARLAMHASSPDSWLHTGLNEIFRDKDIRFYVETWDQPLLAEFYAAGHCLVAPSRGEGKNLPALEMLATGGTVIATDFGGHRMWPLAQVGYPLPCTLTPTFPGRPDAAHDAKVTVQALKDVMWHVYTHRDEARLKGELGAELIPKMCAWDVVLENLFQRIRDQVPRAGEAVWNLAQECRRDRDRELASRAESGRR